jgi:hypothetical protein
MNDMQMFAFESDFVDSLRCVPMAVRLKLDRCGIKLSLRQWSRLTRQDRAELLIRPCETRKERDSYRTTLVALVALRAREEAKPLPERPLELWEDASSTALVVRTYATALGLSPPSDAQWATLTPLQRFVLIKLTRDSHDNVNFVPAMEEFGLVEMALETG